MAQLTTFLITLSNPLLYITHLKNHIFLSRTQTSRKTYANWGYPPKILQKSFLSSMYTHQNNSFNISIHLSDWVFWGRSINERFQNSSFQLDFDKSNFPPLLGTVLRENSKFISHLWRNICTSRFHINTLRTGSFKLFKHPFPGFLTILTP